jgi:hypothetical protein
MLLQERHQWLPQSPQQGLKGGVQDVVCESKGTVKSSLPGAQILHRFTFPSMHGALQLSTFTVNYMGHPFNNSISENRTMSNVLKWMAVFLMLVLYDVIPGTHAVVYGSEEITAAASSVAAMLSRQLCLAPAIAMLIAHECATNIKSYFHQPGLGSAFGMVAIPDPIRYQLVFLGLAAFGFNYFLENVSCQ